MTAIIANIKRKKYKLKSLHLNVIDIIKRILNILKLKYHCFIAGRKI